MAEAVNITNQISNGGVEGKQPAGRQSVREKITQLQAGNSSATASRTGDSLAGTGSNMRGPRRISIQRSSAGFGFTLRHFIVYPPDSVSDCPEEWHRGMSAGLLDPMVPMDTIFVKHVRENGPAAKAGLATGDQVVSVNGESVMCKSYAQVVQMIQRSGPTLELMVMPKEHDVLQQCFADTAHNPHTNVRPVVPVGYAQPDALSPAHANPMSAETLKSNILSHLPRPKPYQPFQVEAKKTAAPPSAAAHAAALQQPRPSSAPLSRGQPLAKDESLSAMHAKLVAAALVSQSVRKSADFNATLASAEIKSAAAGTGSADVMVYPSAMSRNRSSFVDYPASGVPAALSTASKRSSYAGPGTSRAEFILSMNPPTFSVGNVTSGICVRLDANVAGHQSLPSVAVQGQAAGETSVHGSTCSLAARRDSLTSSKGSLYSDERSDQVMSRIKKSFEQKEEFLKRPALPYWVNEVQSPPIPKEFYAQPQKFARPLWPPNCLETSLSNSGEVGRDPASGASPPPASNVSTVVQKCTSFTTKSHPTETSCTVVTSIEPWSMVFTSSKLPASPTNPQPTSPVAFIGHVPNTVPKPFVPGGNPYVSSTPPATSSTGRNFVSTLTRIQENIASDPAAERRDLDLKLKPVANTFNAPLASPEEYTPSPTKLVPSGSLSRSGDASGIHAALAALVPETVSKRAKQFEQNGLLDPCNQSKTPAGASLPLGEKGLLSRIAQRKQETTPPTADEKRRESASRSRSESPEVVYRPLSGNRTIIIGSTRLHCEPPPGYDFDTPERTNEQDALCNGKNDSESRKTVLRQHSYRSAVRALNASTSSLASMSQADPVCDPACRHLLRSSSVDENSNSHSSTPKRPSHLHLTSPLVLPGGDDRLCSRPVGCAAAAADGGDASCASPASLSTPPSPIASDFELSVLERFDQLMASLGSFTNHSSSGASGSSSNGGTTPHDAKLLGGSAKSAEATPNSITAHVNRRQKIYDDGDDNERAMRRVSYLKATAGDRQHVDSDGEVNESETDQVAAAAATPTTAVAEQAKGGRPEHRTHPHSIQKLRLLFGDSKGSTVSPTAKSPSGQLAPSVQSNVVAPAPAAAPAEMASVKDGSPSPNWLADATREGWLNVKQTIVDYRRSTDRSWRQLWAKLRMHYLHFFRDKKDSAHMIVPGTDEMSIDLRGSTVDVALDYTKRKHVLRLTTANGPCEYLLQCEDNNDMILWLQTLQERASDKDDARGPGSGANVIPVSGGYSNCEMVLRKQAQELENSAHAANSKGIRKFSAFHRNRSPTGHSPVSKTRKPSLVGEPPPSPNKPKTWKGKVAKQLKKMQGSSPNSPSQSQLPEGATIGVLLEDCPRSSISEHIPLIVELGVGIVEARGLECIGVYRVPGNTAAVTALTESLNRGFDGLNQQDPRWNDVNVISSLLKSFFRKLPDPLITSEYYGSFIEASKTEPDSVRCNSLKRLVDELPEPHYSTLRYLICHLARVAKKSYINKMEARNLAIVFGPTLIRPADDNTVTMVTDMSHQCRIVETLIDKCDMFFPEDPAADVPANKSPSTTQINAVPPVDDRKDVYAKEIVSSIIMAARRKRQTSMDSPDLSSRPADQNGSQQSQEDLADSSAVPAARSVEQLADSSSLNVANIGSAHSLVELGSSGGLPALPVEASESRVPAHRSAPEPEPILIERKRSASLGGEAILQQMTDVSSASGAEASLGSCSGGAESLEQMPSGEFRSRTSSGSFVTKNYVHPIDAAGIRSYCGLSAFTQERIRRFEQETKALLQRDLARQTRRDVDVPRLDKTQVETAWQRAKIEMETDDILDALADNPSDVVEQISAVSEQPQETEENLSVPPASEEPAEALSVAEEIGEKEVEPLTSSEPVPADPAVSEVIESVLTEETFSEPTQSDAELDSTPAVEESTNNQPSEESAEAKPCQSINETSPPSAATSVSSPVQKVAKNSASAASSTPTKSSLKGASGRSQIPKLSTPAKSFDSATVKGSGSSTPSNSPVKVVSSKTSSQSATGPKTTPITSGRSTVTSHTVTSRSKTVELPKNKKMEHAKIVRQQSAGAIHPHSPVKTASGKLPVTPKVNPRSKIDNPNNNVKRPSLTSMKSVEEVPKKSAAPDSSELLQSIASNLDSTVRGFLSTEDEETTCLEDTPMNGPLSKDYRNPSLHRARGEETEPEERNKGNVETKSVNLITATETKVAVKRPVELKVHDNKVKRSDSLTKDEKTECNTKLARERLNGGSAGRPKRFVQRGESGLKRRHTVGGTRDFDKVRIHWLANNNNNKELDEADDSAAPRWSAWDRLQPLVSDEDLNVDRSLKTWMKSERMRTSSPELCRRSEACMVVGGCPPLMLLDTENEPPEELVTVPST